MILPLAIVFIIPVGLCQHNSSQIRKDESENLSETEKRRYGNKLSDCANYQYRNIDGFCNNIERPELGMPLLPYARLLPYAYGDGLYSFPRSTSGHPLPNVRKISFSLFTEDTLKNDPIWNLNAGQWGQIIAHDMTLVAGISSTYEEVVATCCDTDGQIPCDAKDNVRCAPIITPPDDPVINPNETQCMDFLRTKTTIDKGCSQPNQPAKPLTEVTAFMDLSLVYGNSEDESDKLRAGVDGKLKGVVRSGRFWPQQYPNVSTACLFVKTDDEPCFWTGDIRTNQSPHLAMLQIILFREHNRIADALVAINQHWTDEKTFQETRRILIAQYQHINYYEWLPIYLGYENMQRHRLIYPGAQGYIDDYNPSIDPSVLDEHATAAFRHFHTLIQGYLRFATEARQSKCSIRLSDWYYRPMVIELSDNFDHLVRGLTAQQQGQSDQFWDREVTDYFARGNNTFGMDLRALDIQRSRSHGLASYVATRAFCGLSVPNTFDDMIDVLSPQNVEILQTLYESPLDVELVVAGSLEEPVPGTQVGPTFLHILIEQFYRTRVGDRFFYENGLDSKTSFTLSQLNTIRSSSMARLLCNNADDVKFMQPQAFQQIKQGSNYPIPCEELPKLNLELWKEIDMNEKKPSNSD